MATRKYVTEDGSIFDDKASAHAHECRTPLIVALMSAGLAQDEAHANDILAYFEANFRVPTKRSPRKPKHEGGGTGSIGGSSGGNGGSAGAAVVAKGKK